MGILNINNIAGITKFTILGGYLQTTVDYFARVLADSGLIVSKNATNDLYNSLPQQSSIQFGWVGVAGSKKRTSTVWSWFTKLYDMFFGEVDGVEKTLNGDFSNGDANWSLEAGWSISNLLLTCDGTNNGRVTQSSILEAYKHYKIVMDVQDYTSGQVEVYSFVDGSSKYVLTDIVDNKITYHFTTALTTLYLRSYSFNGSISNISVKEVNSLPNDATQTTESLQPYVSGNIAPNENEGLKNVNGDARYMEHPEISFAAGDEWSVSTLINWNGSIADREAIFGKTASSMFQIRQGTANTFRLFTTTDAVEFGSSVDIIGKSVVLTLVYDGIDTVSLYKNGVLVSSETFVSAISIDTILNGDSSYYLKGKLNAHLIRNVALTAPEVLEEATLLQQYYPEIPSVEIGSQTWATSNFEAVATPMGTVISEMQDSVAVELVTNIDDREFNNDTGWLFSDASISGGKLIITASSGYGRKNVTSIANVGDWVKVEMLISTYISGSRIGFRIGSSSSGNAGSIPVSSTGSVVYYTKLESPSINDSMVGGSSNAGNFVGEVDSFSYEKLGWADSQNLYDGLIAQGESVYDATKAAAMWCYYNNDLATGAIYGKLYNRFAVSLLQQDIDLYNASNPDWGWHVPTQTEFTALQTALGGTSVAGGKMKVAGTDYWNSPNTGADNDSGFTLLGGGFRAGSNGLFYYPKLRGYIAATDGHLRVRSDATYSIITTGNAREGYSLRLLKD